MLGCAVDFLETRVGSWFCNGKPLLLQNLFSSVFLWESKYPLQNQKPVVTGLSLQLTLRIERFYATCRSFLILFPNNGVTCLNQSCPFPVLGSLPGETLAIFVPLWFWFCRHRDASGSRWKPHHRSSIGWIARSIITPFGISGLLIDMWFSHMMHEVTDLNPVLWAIFPNTSSPLVFARI